MNEEEIIARVLAGEVDSFEFIVERYKQQVFGIVGRYVPLEAIDDVSQEVFIRAFKSLEGYRGQASLGHWISKIAVRATYDYWRRTRRIKELNLTHDHLELLDANHSLSQFSEKSYLDRIRELSEWAMDKLSAESKVVVSLLYLEQYSEKETAELLGWSVAKVKSKAFQARFKLRSIIQKLRNNFRGQ